MGLTMVQIWLILLVVLLVIEFATAALTTIWFATGALAALICAIMGGPMWLQIALFAAVSVVLLVLTRPLAEKLRNRTVRTNADSLIGQEAVVTQYIDNLHSSGEVVVNGQHWSARSVNPEHTIEKGEVVMIRSIEGVKLIVGKRIEPGKQE